jgi:hypothetical protein
MKFGFFAKMMRPTYTEAAEVKGNGFGTTSVRPRY